MRRRLAALLDANVLWSPQQRNLLLQFAIQEIVSAHWSLAIEEEWLRNMDAPLRARLELRTLPLLRAHFPNALIEGADDAPALGTTHRKDRHVAAAAIKIAPCVLVTWNLVDFDVDQLAVAGVRVQTPDAFLGALFDSNPDLIFSVTREAQENLTRSMPSWDDYLHNLADKNNLKGFVRRLRERTMLEASSSNPNSEQQA